MSIVIRPALKEDSQQLIQLFCQLDSESSFMLFESGERQTTLSEQEAIMQTFVNSRNRAMFVVENQQNEITGFIVGDGGSVLRNKHVLHCVIGVLKSSQGAGLGGQLFDHLKDWAIAHSFHRMELCVMEGNHAAIKLYQSHGFVQEGVKKHSLKVDNNYINEYIMAKLL